MADVRDFVVVSGLSQEQYDRVVSAMVAQFGPVPMLRETPAVKDSQGNVVRAAIPPAPEFTNEEFAKRKVWEWVLGRVVEMEKQQAMKTVGRAAEQKAMEDFAAL